MSKGLIFSVVILLSVTAACSVFVPVYVVNHSDSVLVLEVGVHSPDEFHRGSADLAGLRQTSGVHDRRTVTDVDTWESAVVEQQDSITARVLLPPRSTVWVTTTMNWIGRLRSLCIDGVDLRSDSSAARIEERRGWFSGYHEVVHVGE